MYLYIDTYTHIRQQWSLLQDRLFLSFYIIYVWPVLCKTGGVKTLSFLHIYIQKLWRDKKETGWSQSRYRTEDKQEKVTFYYISCYTLLVLNQVNSLHVLKKKNSELENSQTSVSTKIEQRDILLFFSLSATEKCQYMPNAGIPWRYYRFGSRPQQ